MKLDRFVTSVTLTSSNNKVRINEGPFGYTATIAPGKYWLYDAESSVDQVTGYPSFYRALWLAISAAAPSSYRFSLGQVPGEASGIRRALVLRQVSAGASFSWSLAHPDFTLDKRLIGFAPTATVSPLALSLKSFASPHGIFGTWLSPREAQSKVSYPLRTVVASTEEVWRDDAYQLTWQSARARLIRYELLAAVWLHASRASQQDYAAAWGVPLGDTSCAFETIWDRLSALEDVLIFHDVGGEELGMSASAHAGMIEVVRLYDAGARERFDGVLSERYQLGEQYDLTLPLIARPASSYIK